MAEHARYVDSNPDAESLKKLAVGRQLYSIEATFSAVLDVRKSDVLKVLSPLVNRRELLEEPLFWFRSQEAARQVAQYCRQLTPIEAIIVPSMPFFDNVDHNWNMVVFMEKFGHPPECFTAFHQERVLRYEASHGLSSID